MEGRKQKKWEQEREGDVRFFLSRHGNSINGTRAYAADVDVGLQALHQATVVARLNVRNS